MNSKQEETVPSIIVVRSAPSEPPSEEFQKQPGRFISSPQPEKQDRGRSAAKSSNQMAFSAQFSETEFLTPSPANTPHSSLFPTPFRKSDILGTRRKESGRPADSISTSCGRRRRNRPGSNTRKRNKAKAEGLSARSSQSGEEKGSEGEVSEIEGGSIKGERARSA